MRSSILSTLIASIICALTTACGAGFAQEEEEEEPFLPGLIGEYQQAGREPVRRLDPVVAARWTDRPDERLVVGKPATVTWHGVLLVPDDGKYQLHVHARGDVQVEVNAKSVVAQENVRGWASSKGQTLTFGPMPLRVTFTPHDEPAEVSLFWSSDKFEREPVPARFLAHDRKQVVSTDFERGRVLARALRCEACHAEAAAPSSQPIPAPALDRLAGNMHREWLVDWLTASKANQERSNKAQETIIERRMPYLSLSKDDAESLADWLLDPASQAKPEQPTKPEKPEKRDPKKPVPSAEAGEQLLLTKGCLACHRVGEFGESGLFGGGDLTAIAAKRPASFFSTWLSNPESLNRDHRMPVFELTADERQSLVLALGARGKGTDARGGNKSGTERARELARQQRCDQCHRLPDEESLKHIGGPKQLEALGPHSRWNASCADGNIRDHAHQPAYDMTNMDAAALKAYYTQRQPGRSDRSDQRSNPQSSGEQLLIENNCLACHNREPQPAGVLPKKFGDKLVAVAKKFEDLAPQVPAMTPPSLNSVGDKLTDTALTNAITRASPAHRPYLLVQMPKFRLSKEQTEQLTAHLIQTDRIPDYDRGPTPPITPQLQEARTLAGKRLVGTDGFSCTSCHQVGSVLPVKAPPAARGPTLSMPQDRLRKSWFDRFVRNPSRIVPRMEMPSVQTPVRGVLQDKLDDQLAAVWQTLSTPGFEPPLPEPVRTLRFYSSEDNSQKQPLVITDLIEHEGQTLERAALIGLPNRHNLLFDFATNRLLAWSQGDLARQRTKGKNWYWEPAGSELLNPGLKQSEFAFEKDGQMWEPVADGQWLAELNRWQLTFEVASFDYKLRFRRANAPAEEKPLEVIVRQFIEPSIKSENGFERRIELGPVPLRAKIHWRVLDATRHKVKPEAVTITPDKATVRLPLGGDIQIKGDGSPVKFSLLPSGTVVMEPSAAGGLSCSIRYTSTLPPDEYFVPRAPAIQFAQPPITIAPGLHGERMTLPTDIMPTALAWRPNGELVVASLKGQVLSFAPHSLDSPQPQGKLLADGLAAPYGLHAESDFVDVVTKSALVRLTQHPDLQVNECVTLASGWGYTSDYHDWAVGLPRDAAGNYYIALPCFQDNRAEAAKRLRGSVLKLVPRKTESRWLSPFGIEVLTYGHRFPMGMALNTKGELFVSDNQGNYNPFNELNHVVPGKHFGFVNKGEKAPESHTAPTISIPHPWTRSVNGICFLNTPAKLIEKGEKRFGPMEGHLVGCEYDTKRLIRMSLQKVGHEYQGCCYPLTVPAPPEEAPLGPLCCEVSPSGELFIGSVRDSGWGAGNNIGEVIRVKFDASQLGHGLAEMRATASGFELDFFKPVEKSLAEDFDNYSLSSYRRESTPSYGGNDIDRRTEKLGKATLSADGKRVSLTLPALRAGHVYELRLKSLAPEGEPFFPAEAHYTLRQLVN